MRNQDQKKHDAKPWTFVALIVAAELLEIDRASGKNVYPAVQVTRRGGTLSYTTGSLLSAAPPPRESTEDNYAVLTDATHGTFKTVTHMRTSNIRTYTELLRFVADVEPTLRQAVARAVVEEEKERARAQNYSQPSRRKAG